MDTNIELAKLIFSVAQFLLTGGVGIYVYISNKNKVTNDRITTLEGDIDTKLDNHGERVATLEVEIRKAPSHKDLSSIHEKINRVSEGVNALNGEFGGVRRLLDTIHQHLLSGGR